jgi:Flp pilus assembly protein protease CpaA
MPYAVGVTGLAVNGWGGGDAKMLIMAGAWLGWYTAMSIMLAGGLIALLCFAVKLKKESLKMMKDQLVRIWLTVFWKAKDVWKGFKGIDEAPDTVPFGACLAVGSWLVMLLY